MIRIALLALLALLLPLATGCGGSGSESDGDTAPDGDSAPDGDTTPDGDTVVDGDEGETECILKSCPAGTSCRGRTLVTVGQAYETCEQEECAGETRYCIDGCLEGPPARCEGDPDPDGDLTCDHEGFVPAAEKVVLLGGQGADGLVVGWEYTAPDAVSGTFSRLVIEHRPGHPRALQAPGTLEITNAETDYLTCGICLLVYADCTRWPGGRTECGRVFMPRAGGSITLDTLDWQAGGSYRGSISGVRLREVEISTSFPTRSVEGGERWCLPDQPFEAGVMGPGWVDIEKPTGLPCEYPDGPYYFIGPEPDQATPAPGTVPPLVWPGAYYGHQKVGLDLARFRCENPEIKTLIIWTSAGWCPACLDQYKGEWCQPGGLAEQLAAHHAEVLWVMGDTNTVGEPATNEFAEAKVNFYGCDEGFRISDTDSNAGWRSVWNQMMSGYIPWAAVIRMRDMKLVAEQSDGRRLNFISIADQIAREVE